MAARMLRWFAALALVLALYAIAGFWGVPALLRWQLPRLAASHLDRPAEVGEVHFNPFTLRLRLQDLRLTERDGAALVALRGLDADLDWRSIVQRTWSLRHVRLDAPQVRLAIARDGRSNLGTLVDAMRPHLKPGDQREAGQEIPRVVVQDFSLVQGRLEWDDRQVDFHTVLAPLDLHVVRLSTLPGDRDTGSFTAELEGGGRLRWRGEASLQPLRAKGEVVLEDLALANLSAYLKPYVRAVVASGQLSATLPYELAYHAGRLEARLQGARLAIAQLSARRDKVTQRFAALKEIELRDVDADLGRREATVGALRVADGELGLRRDARGAWDLAQLVVHRDQPAAQDPPAPWKVAVRQVQLRGVAVRVLDESVQPAVTLMAGSIGGQVRIDAAQTAQALALRADGGSLQVERLALAQAGRPPLTLERLAIQDATLDLGARRIEVGQVALEGGQVQVARDAQGRIDLMALLPASPGAPAPASPAWTARVAEVVLARTAIDVDDQGTGIRARLQDVKLRLQGVGTDLAQPVPFEAGLRLRDGGQLAAQGRLVPATRSIDAQVQLDQLALAAAQPLLARHVRLKLASGALSTRGRLEAAFAEGKPPVLRYAGRAEIANLRLDELDGKLFASWKSVSADRLAVSTRGLDVPELRVVAPEASLILNPDRSFNAARLLVAQPAAPGTAPARAAGGTTAAGDPFPVRIERLRLQDAKLEFQDQSLPSQFGARIYALNGVVTGLSTRRDARSQVELDGRVDQFGLARVRGALNPFSPRDSTDLNVVFRNVDMVPATPYAMKFAGYRIAEGKLSLDLRYRVRDSRLEGDNKIVIDKLTLGERVDSPDALKLPLELAIAILKDPEGRIDLGVPVTGDLSDPKFSYGAVVWKAFSNVLAGIVSAPFRALAGMFGGSGEKLESVAFDAGSARLLPPEREKLGQMAQMLAKRGQLRLVVPAQFNEAVDGAALRTHAVRADIVRRAGLRLEPGETPGPLNFAEPSVRGAVRELYTQRFGDPAWQQAKVAAENERPRGEASGAAGTPVPAWRKFSNLVQGEPQVTDPAGFYRSLVRRMEQEAPLAPDALAQLGTQRAQAVVAALTEAGVDGSRLAAGAPSPVAAEAGKPVPLKLELAVR